MSKFIIGLTTSILLVISTLAPGAQQGAKPESAPTEKTPAKQADITWYKYREGLDLAKKEGKKVFLEFTARWCGYCRKMHATTFKDSTVVAMLDKHYISVTVDGDSRDTINLDGWITTEKKMTREYGVTGYPTYWILTSEGERITPLTGYLMADYLAGVLDYLKDDIYKTVKYQEFLEQKKKNK